MVSQVDRNRNYRNRMRARIEELEKENAALKAELDLLRPKADHGAGLERRIKELEGLVHGLNQRVEHIEAMANQGY